MKKLFLILLPAIALLISCSVHAQSDYEYINRAKKSLQTTKDCDKALRTLEKVSARGKNTPAYLLCMANAQDCSFNKDQAIIYYNKYLTSNPGNDSVKKRVTELSEEKAQEDKVSVQVRNIKNIYGKSTGEKIVKGKHMSIYRNFSLWGMCFKVPFNGPNTPYKGAIGPVIGRNFPLLHNHITLGYTARISLLFRQNKDWLSKVYDIPVEEVEGGKIGMACDISFVPAVVIVNHRKLGLTAGPEVGVGIVRLPEISSYFSGDYQNETNYGVRYGAGCTLMIGSSFTIVASYSMFSVHEVTVTQDTYTGRITHTTPANNSTLSIGICVRSR